MEKDAAREARTVQRPKLSPARRSGCDGARERETDRDSPKRAGESWRHGGVCVRVEHVECEGR